jgi:hypothetical protein
MKKTTLITLLTIAAFSTANNGAFAVQTSRAAAETVPAHLAVMMAGLPAGLVVPAVLPAGVQDSELLEAWIRVDQQQDAIQLWGDVTVSGRGLAQYLLEHGIPVEWDTGNVCRNGSCSVLACAKNDCTYDDGKPSVAPIYVAPVEHGDMPSLISTLAHEIFHRTQPFGPVRDTRYEEYWAFLVGARVSKSVWPSFGAFDPLDPEHLNLWLQLNGLDYYFQIPEYPAAAASRVHQPPASGDPHEGLPPQMFGTPATR